LSRFRIFTLLATIALAAAALAACGGGGDSDSSGGGDAQQVLDTATLEGVKSGTFDMSLAVKSDGDTSGDIDVTLSGPFQSKGAESLPEADFDITASGSGNGESIDFDGGITLLSDRAFIAYEGTEYEVDPTTFGFVKSAFEQAQSEGGAEGAEATACTEAATKLDVGSFVDNVSEDGDEDVEGTATTKVSGDLEPEAFVNAITTLAEDPACASQLEAAGSLPLDELEEAKDELKSAVKKAHVEIYVGNDDDIIRRVSGELSIEPESSGESVELSFDVTLGAVNEEQTISAPADAEPLEGLFSKIGIDPSALLEAGSSEGGLGGLLEGLGGGAAEAESPNSTEITPSEGSSDPEASIDDLKKFSECLEQAKTPNDLSKCSALVE
jgi:hypothetical protein